MKMFYKQKLLALGVCTFFLAVAFIISPVSPVLAQEIQVIVNGQKVQFPDQQPFINKDNRILVPVRVPMEAAGAAVAWDGGIQLITVAKRDKVAAFFVGSRLYATNYEASMLVFDYNRGFNNEDFTVNINNGKIKQMDTEAQIAGNRTVFPIRFVAEAIGLNVTWDE